jgi:molybdopterin molybdotransferase
VYCAGTEIVTDIKARPSHDVRMHGFTRRHTVQAALAWLDAQLSALEAESVPLRSAAGRVLASAVVSDVDVPGFDRSTMDGYAVVADSTEGATPYNRVTLNVVGDALPGSSFVRTLARGEAVRIMTGAPMPAGSDAVLPAESVDVGRGGSDVGRGGSSASAEATADRRSLGEGWLDPSDTDAAGSVAAISTVSPGKNVGRRGEDIVSGTIVLEAGRVLRPQDLGVMSSIGLANATVVRRPRVRLVITGNELLPSGSKPHHFHITDANGPMLAALAERDGAVVDFPGLVRDEADAILAALHASADIVIVSGGSSVGIEDLAPTLVATHGELAVHGIAMRPSSPTGMGRLGQRLVFLLPGNPVSALCAYDFFAGRAIRGLGGRSKEWPYRSVRATLARKISSPIGRLDYARVRLDPSTALGAGARVEPLSVSGASVLSSTTRADGFVIVGDDSEGFAAGSAVDVWLYGPYA